MVRGRAFSSPPGLFDGGNFFSGMGAQVGVQKNVG
jgi:hypothetical protein